MIKLIIVFFIFLYSANSSVDEREFNTRWGCADNYCNKFIANMDKDDFQIVDIRREDDNTIYVYLADYKLVNRNLNKQLDDSVIAIVESH